MVRTSLGTVYRFGPFQVNAIAGELLKNGNRIKLQDQPFRLLLVLLENAGEMVTRADLRQRIWPQDTFVDFDSSLRVAVRKLREALGDDAESPQYVETIPKRGYRFLVADVLPEDAVDPAPNAAVKNAETVESGAALPSWSRWIAWTLLLLIVSAAATAVLLSRRRPRVLTAQDTIVLADFVNTTGDPVFDGTLRQGVAVQLEQSPFLNLIPEERLQQTLGLMGQPAGVRLTPAVALEICERTASTAVLDGSITSFGSRYVVGLRAKECRSGKILAEEQVQAAKKEEVLSALGQVASRFRIRLGESLATVEKHNTPLAEATTSSLDALKAYSTGWKVNYAEGEAAALPFFTRAIEIDSRFAMAYAALGLMYGTTGESDLASENTSKAYALLDRVSDKEKFFIAAYYDGRVTGNQEKAQQTCEAWIRTYDREVGPHSFLAGFIYPASGKYAISVDEDKQALQLDPDGAILYLELASNYAALDRIEDAKDTLRIASARRLENPAFLVQAYDMAFLQSDKAGMDRAAALAQEKSGAEDWISDHQAFALAYSGRLREARSMSQHAANLAQQASHKERAALFETGPALWEAMFGNAGEARRNAMAALALAKDREVEYGAAFALALSGDSSQSQLMANDLEDRYPQDTAVRFSYLPALRALLALNHGEPSRAIELLRVAAPYELGEPRSKIQGFFGALYPIYVRGEAYLVEKRGAEAAVEFQKILDHRGIVYSDPIGVLAHLQLGRAYALSGERIKAKAAYEDFLTLWKDADPEISIFRQAKQEYAKLQ